MLLFMVSGVKILDFKLININIFQSSAFKCHALHKISKI